MLFNKLNVKPGICDTQLIFNTSKITNPFTGGVKFVTMSGSKWQLSLGYKLSMPENIRKMEAILAGLKGGSVVIRVTDFTYTGKDHLRGLSITIDGDGLTGNILKTAGWVDTGSAPFERGDKISWVDPGTHFEELHIITDFEAVRADGSLTLTIEPEIKRPTTDGVQIELINPACSAYLTNDGGGVKRLEKGKIATCSLVFQEAIYGL